MNERKRKTRNGNKVRMKERHERAYRREGVRVCQKGGGGTGGGGGGRRRMLAGGELECQVP